MTFHLRRFVLLALQAFGLLLPLQAVATLGHIYNESFKDGVCYFGPSDEGTQALPYNSIDPPDNSYKWDSTKVYTTAYSEGVIEQLEATHTEIPFTVQPTAGKETYVRTYFVKKSYVISTASSPSAGGSVTGGGMYLHGTSVTLTATANAEYKFVQWQDGNTQNPRTVTVTGDVTYTATFGKLTYTISFKKGMYGSGTEQSLLKTHGTTLTLPGEIFKRGGYEQKGWSYDVNGTTKDYSLKGSYTKNEATTLYPYWSAKQYTITIMPGYDGGKIETKTYSTSSANQTINISEPSRSGWTFSSWQADFSSVVGTKPTVNTSSILIPANTYGDFTITAQWTGKSYTITVSSNGGTGGSSVPYTTSESQQILDFTEPKRDGYDIGSWSVGSGWTGSQPAVAGQKVTIPANTYGSFTITPTWSGMTYSVTIEPGEGGTGGDATSYKVSDSLWQWNFSAPTRLGYHIGSWSFAGWFKSQPTISGTTLTIAANAYGDISATPNWSANTATVAYENYGTFGAFHPTAMTYDSVLKVSRPTKEGNSFAGWQVTVGLNPATAKYSVDGGETWQNLSSDEMKVGSDCETLYLKNLTAVQGGTVNLYANWGTQCTITVLAEPAAGGSVSGGGTYAGGSDVDLVATPSNGYSFVRWKDDLSETATRTVTVTVDATYTACFTGNVYEVSFISKPGKGSPDPINVRFGEAYGELDEPTTPPEGYEFAGWYTKQDGEAGAELITSESRVATADDHKLYAHYNALVHNYHYVRFDGNDATNETEMALQTFSGAETNALSPNVYGKVGYTFAGWATNFVDAASCRVTYTNCQAVSFPTAQPNETNDLYAVWTTNRYTIVFNPGNAPADTNHYFFGTMEPLTNCLYDTAITIRCGWTNYCSQGLKGWSKTQGAEEADYPVRTTSPLTQGSDAIVSNLTDTADGTVKLYAVWADVGKLSTAAGLNNAVLFNDDSSKQDWADSVDKGSCGGSCVATEVTDDGKHYLSVKVICPGTLRFSWRHRGTKGQRYFRLWDGSGFIDISKTPDGEWHTNTFSISGSGEHTLKFFTDLNSCTMIDVRLEDITWTPEADEVLVDPTNPPKYETEEEAEAAATKARVIRWNSDIEGVVSAEAYNAMFEVYAVTNTKSVGASDAWTLMCPFKECVSNDLQAVLNAAAAYLADAAGRRVYGEGPFSVSLMMTNGLYYGLAASDAIGSISTLCPTNWVLGEGKEQELKVDRPSEDTGFFRLRVEVRKDQ